MKITIDEKICKKYHLTLQEALIGLALREDPQLIENMLDAHRIIQQDAIFVPDRDFEETLHKLYRDITESARTEEELLLLAVKMQEHYPEGKRNSISPYYRGNKSEIAKKLKNFFSKYGDYSDEDILSATDRFVSSFQGDYTYLPLLKYFITKLKPVEEEDGTRHNVEFSPLADFLENKGEFSREHPAPADWSMNLRN